MVRNSTSYRCTECGWQSARWVGRCGECQAWGSVAEAQAPTASVAAVSPARSAVPISDVDSTTTQGIPTGIGELDRVLGQGLTPGAVLLLAGEPGVGKSTLLLEVAARWAAAGRDTLYVTAEESAAQVRQRAERTGAVQPRLYLAAEPDLATVLGHIEQLKPKLLVLDSIQTVSLPSVDGVPGGVTQVREATAALVRVAKQRGLPVVLVGHVTKEGSVAGPKTLEHLVDVVLSFEGDRHSGFRMLRASKNRYGPADEVGCFELIASGIREVTDPTGLFVSRHTEPAAGTCLGITLEGRRPLLAEVQALVVPTAAPAPRRVTHGVEFGRVSMILAVLQRKAGVKLHTREVYVSTVGGASVGDPAADLAIAVAVASAAAEHAFDRPIIALGEVGLSGELRRVPGLDRRLAEAGRLGFGTALVPAGSGVRQPGMRVVEAATVSDALGMLGLRRQARKPGPTTDPDRPRLVAVEN
ncbi:MAG: DNA repair protein RadA [Propionicimonas sp.]|uniref:DNA repair protein RadA n=1 Tax=Propionicimonas sp. TaxID=1955623 RepID=UPI002B20ABD3|nr:DNA repair protein RadA [Propionicimonas sp.]MEA4944912.1 DNA repair protein RadA [Propionicimonas sp.]MEA5053507.1 DNA repair protein RadA [Propionicimonas sp.]MEA5117526.1 DNA repair protein RadA [Propionicimonas sp.]